MFVLVPVCVLVFMSGYQCIVMCFPVSECNVIVNRWGPETMGAYSSLSSIFLEIRKKELFWILSLESIISSRNNHKPAKGSLWSSQLFVTSPHLLIYTSNSCAKWLQYGLQLSHKVTFADPETILAIQHEWKVTLCVINKCLEKYLVQNAHLNYCNFNPYLLFFCIQ